MVGTDTGGPVAPRPGSGVRGWVRVVLVVSVTLNLLVAGVVVGGLLADRSPMRHLPGEVSFGPLTEALSEADRVALRRAAQGEGASLRAMRQAAGEDLARFVAALRAEPWDEAGVRAAFAAQRARAAERGQFGERLLLARIAAMTSEERQAFADRLESRAAARAERRREAGRD